MNITHPGICLESEAVIFFFLSVSHSPKLEWRNKMTKSTKSKRMKTHCILLLNGVGTSIHGCFVPGKQTSDGVTSGVTTFGKGFSGRLEKLWCGKITARAQMARLTPQTPLCPSEAVSVSHLSPESLLSGLSCPSVFQAEAAYLSHEQKGKAGRQWESLNCLF